LLTQRFFHLDASGTEGFMQQQLHRLELALPTLHKKDEAFAR
jgi:hypothetical protein